MHFSSQVWHAWISIGLIVALGVAAVWEWARHDPRRRTPDAVKALRARHAAGEPVSPAAPEDTPAIEPTVPVPPVDDIPPVEHEGATVMWSPAAELAAVGDGELLPPGIPTVSIDDVPDADLIRPGTPMRSVDDYSDIELWDAEFEEDLRRLDDTLEAARRLCTANMVASAAAIGAERARLAFAAIQAIDLRDLESHERARDDATVLITMAVEPLARRSHRPTVAQARRQRHRDRRALGGAQ